MSTAQVTDYSFRLPSANFSLAVGTNSDCIFSLGVKVKSSQIPAGISYSKPPPPPSPFFPDVSPPSFLSPPFKHECVGELILSVEELNISGVRVCRGKGGKGEPLMCVEGI